MKRDYQKETDNRVKFIQQALKNANATGVVFGNSGGKDGVLVGILCKLACSDTVGVMMPISSKRNYGEDIEHGEAFAKQFHIENILVDLTEAKESMAENIAKVQPLNQSATTNINPRLRMTTLYAIGASRNALVAGTGNRSERYLGYFTKHGDGGYDFNPIADLTVKEVYEFLEYLNAPKYIIEKAPSAGLFDGQTDEEDLGLSYDDLDGFLLTGEGEGQLVEKVQRMHAVTEHKRTLPLLYRSETSNT